MMEIWDTHAHYDDAAFDADRDTVIRALKDAGEIGGEKVSVRRVTNIGCDLASSRTTDALTKKYADFYGAIGVIPENCAGMTEADLQALEQLAAENPKIRAIGEIGLDYHYDDGPDRDIQKKWFGGQMELAATLHLPIVIHSRDAAEDTISLMKQYRADRIGGVIHCYSYSRETAEIFLKMGFFFGIGGVLTFRNAKKLKRALEVIPMERIVLETDSPYLSPEPRRGSRNDSRNLKYVAAKIAELKGLSPAEVCRITYENAERLYRTETA